MGEVIPINMKHNDELLEVWTREEDLDPRLVPYLVDTEWGQGVKHPLIFQIPLASRAIANMHFRNKLNALEKASKNRDWNSYVMIHERPHRAQALIDLLDIFSHTGIEVSDDDWGELVALVWVDSENIWQYMEEWENIFKSVDHSESMMTYDEREQLRQLPDPVTVYRGAIRELNEDGLSWTVDRYRASWFAQRFGDAYGEPVVIHGKIAKSEIRALLGARGEAEIVAKDRESVTIDLYEDV